ncbi:Phage minor capsid protein 2 [Curtobacterium sp. 9128]|uniref:phage minor capsid protein n=1 Tax=Curtobacterium sp. 9128 TaxID=1793722 RepID=UPI0007D7166C|nr:phage minor capsid protein [Curtobacterium sp. 9128]SBN64448.1 Phage minor capsid protein 2 [Curtobacterium sp. 9128]
MATSSSSQEQQPERRRRTAEAVAALVALHIGAESTLLDGISAILRRAVSLEAARPAIRRLVYSVVRQLDRQVPPLVDEVIDGELIDGSAQADRDVFAEIHQHGDEALEALARAAGRRALPPGASRETPGGHPPAPPGTTLAMPGGESGGFDFSVPRSVRSEAAIREDLVSSLQDVRRRLTRLDNDIYKVLAPQAARVQVLDVELTPAQAQAIAWRDFTSNGITGFTDKSGREWSLSAYTEMAVRTAAARAFNAAHLERMKAIGGQYFTVSDVGSPCPLCLPWQNAVLTDGPIATPEMHVDATIAEATSRGLFHPQCRHHLTIVFPGITVLPPRQTWTPAHDARYKAVQKQRRLELAIRKAKRQVENALDAEQAADAASKVRRAQKRLRDHVNSRDDLARNSRREQPHLRDAYAQIPLFTS